MIARRKVLSAIIMLARVIGAVGPASCARSGDASAYEIGITGIFRMVRASLMASRLA